MPRSWATHRQFHIHDHRLWSYRSGIRTPVSTNSDHGGEPARKAPGQSKPQPPASTAMKSGAVCLSLAAPFVDPERYIGHSESHPVAHRSPTEYLRTALGGADVP